MCIYANAIQGGSIAQCTSITYKLVSMQACITRYLSVMSSVQTTCYKVSETSHQ